MEAAVGHPASAVHGQSAAELLAESAHRDGPERIVDALVAGLSAYAPGLDALITDHEFLSPADIEREYGAVEGHWHHGEMSIHQSFMLRPLYGAAQYDTPIDKLFLASAGCHPGGGLTGLPGRRGLNDKLRQLGRRYAIAMLDVDHFKRFNDRFGHRTGDDVLKMIAARMRQIPGGRAFRYGGEEFCIVLPGLTLSQVTALAERARVIIEQLSIRGVTDASAISITASFGVASNEQTTQTLTQLIDRADKALYRSKSSGRKRVSAWNLQPDAGASTLQGDFIRGISRSERAEAAASPEPSPSDIGVLLPEHDSLTGLPNRSVFSEYLSRAIGRAQRKSSPLAVLFVEIAQQHSAHDPGNREVLE